MRDEHLKLPLSTQKPIFILGISARSGTNFLSDLLGKHPDCYISATIWEDYLVYYSDLLLKYTRSVSKRWSWRGITPDKSFEAKLGRSIGDGLIHFLSSENTEKRIVTKTPTAHNLDLFFKVFPQTHLLILVRDGRAVVESRVKTFGESYGTAMRTWSIAAGKILHFQQLEQANKDKYLIVRYEDLWKDVDTELRRIFNFCDLDAEVYDFDEAANLPVRGSSVFHGEHSADAHWEPVKKTKDFDPTARWKHWNRVLHERINIMAGRSLEQFGYELKKYYTNQFLWSALAQILNLISTINFIVWLWIKRIVRGILGKERTTKIRLFLSTAPRKK